MGEYLALRTGFRMVLCLLAGSGEVLGRTQWGPHRSPPAPAGTNGEGTAVS